MRNGCIVSVPRGVLYSQDLVGADAGWLAEGAGSKLQDMTWHGKGIGATHWGQQDLFQRRN